jgi:hypothetical protein
LGAILQKGVGKNLNFAFYTKSVVAAINYTIFSLYKEHMFEKKAKEKDPANAESLLV